MADFIGKSSILEVDGGSDTGGVCRFQIAGTKHQIVASAGCPVAGPWRRKICIRPEKILVRRCDEARAGDVNTFEAVIEEVVNLGARIELIVRMAGDTRLLATVSHEQLASLGEAQTILLQVKPDDVIVLEPERPAAPHTKHHCPSDESSCEQ